ncbi:MAG: class I SAM-dependent methyltransferase [Phycisphaerales bacterium]|nr:MAG: class I SAM-dependent methyltransferase [Phycisphaerales bacterium]
MSHAENTSVATAYRGRVARDYDEARFETPQGRLFSELELQQLNHAARRLERGARVLEVGCGTARFSASLARQGFDVVATDPSADMIEVAAGKCAGTETLRFERMEGGDLSFPNEAFDFVFAIRVTNQTESEEYALRMIREMIRVAKRGALILVEFVNRQRPLGKRARSVRLSFGQIGRVVQDSDCSVVSRHGVLVFSQSVLDRVPDVLVPWWGRVERLAARGFWPWASRGYVLLRKR